MPNIALLNEVMDHIEAHPDQHNQRFWLVPDICGTTACFAGWAVLLQPSADLQDGILSLPVIAGRGDDLDLPEAARELLGLNETQAQWLFSPHRTREELRAAVDYWTILAEALESPAVDLETELLNLVTDSAVLA